MYQSNSNALIAFMLQAGGLGVPANGAGASKLRITGGNGIKLAKTAVASNEIRSDGMSTRGRHGTQKVTVAYSSEASLGSHDAVIQAVMRGAWDAVALSAVAADFTSVTTVANGIVWNTGNPITKGFRVGDVIRGAGFLDAANNNRNLRITGLSPNQITVAETLTVNAGADAGATITRPGKRIINPAALVKSYFTLEEYEADIDQSTLIQDLVFSSLKFSMKSDGELLVDIGGTGTGEISTLANGASPYFPGPTVTTASPFSVVDATIRFGGQDLVELSSFDLMLDTTANAPAVFGSGAQKYSPDVFTGPLQCSLNLTMLRKDLTKLADFIAETQYSLHVLAVNNTIEPKDFLSIVVPNFTLGGVDPAALSRNGGGRTQAISVPAALVGVATDTVDGYDPTMVSFQTTAA